MWFKIDSRVTPNNTQWERAWVSEDSLGLDEICVT